jgi:glucuronate isomerase
MEKQLNSVVFQFSLGAEPLPFETGSFVSQRTISQLAGMVARHPGLRFQCFLSSRHANQSLCTIARELPNLSLAGYWWHNFFPDIIRQVMRERLDMLPATKQIGFFSDAYTIEWAYGKLALVRKLLAQVLGEKIDQGQHTRDEALAVARRVLYEAPRSLLGMVPAESART